MEKTYVVSGYMRSGTSMMMHCLHGAGLQAAYNQNRDHLNTLFGDQYYKPNKYGFYELSPNEWQSPGFPKKYFGQLIKILMSFLPQVVAGNYEIIFMRRPVHEIEKSYMAAFRCNPPLHGKLLSNKIDDIISAVSMRKDMHVTQINYKDVTNNPKKVFTTLKENNWPICIESACSQVDSRQVRYG